MSRCPCVAAIEPVAYWRASTSSEVEPALGQCSIGDTRECREGVRLDALPEGVRRDVTSRPGTQHLDRGLEVVRVGRDVRVQECQVDAGTQFGFVGGEAGGDRRDDLIDLRQNDGDDVISRDRVHASSVGPGSEVAVATNC